MTTLNGSIRWDEPVPDVSERWVHVVSPKPGIPVRGLIVGIAPIGVYTHWLADEKLRGGGRTIPHIDPCEDCHHCRTSSQRPRWHGYLACWNPVSERHFILDLSLHAVQSCIALNPSSGVVLRGRTILLRRVGKAANSPVAAELGGDPLPPEKIPASFDVSNTLMRLWGFSSTRAWRFDDLGNSPPPDRLTPII